jgi:hypothetical protein
MVGENYMKELEKLFENYTYDETKTMLDNFLSNKWKQTFIENIADHMFGLMKALIERPDLPFDQKMSLTEKALNEEFKKHYLYLPRQCGRSTVVYKIIEHFKNQDFILILFHRKDVAYDNCSYYSADLKREMFRGTDTSNKIVICDEKVDRDELEYLLAESGGYKKLFYIGGCYCI